MLLLHHSHINLRAPHACRITCGKTILEDMNSMEEYKCKICNGTFNTKNELEAHKHVSKKSGCG
jgi:hypothetical protein